MRGASRDEPLLPAKLPPHGKNFPLAPFTQVNHNVVINIAMRFAFGLADGIWSGTVLANFLYHVGGNEYAGYAEAAMGIANLVVALPAGWAADRGSKAVVARVGGLALPAAVGLTSFAAIFAYAHTDENAASFALFVSGLCLWGGVQAIANGPAQALYADSIATGDRSTWFQRSFGIYMISSVLGPVISIILFVLHNNTWEFETLRNVFLVGQGLGILGGVFMLCFRERCALDEASPQSTTPSSPSTVVQPLVAAGAATPAAAHPAASAPAAADPATADPTAVNAPSPADGASAPPPTAVSHRHAWSVPYILFTSNLIAGFASGMTIKFFPLYFRCTCGMSPAAVQGIYAIVLLLLAAFSRIGTYSAKRIGRAQFMILVKLLGVSLLVLMALLEAWLTDGVVAGAAERRCPPPGHPNPNPTPAHHGGGAAAESSATGALLQPRWWKVVVIVAIYLLRTALMNCTYPLNSSILMDFTPKHQRARWQSLSSIVRFGWCGSAALGGVLASQYGYSHTFLVTAGLQLLATLVQVALLPIVPRAEKPPRAAAAAAAVAPAGVASASEGPGSAQLGADGAAVDGDRDSAARDELADPTAAAVLRGASIQDQAAVNGMRRGGVV